MKSKLGWVAGFLAVAIYAAQGQVVGESDTFGYQQVSLPPGGSVNLVGFNFTSTSSVTLEGLFGTNQLTQTATLSRFADKVYIWTGSEYDGYYQKSDGVFYNLLTGNPASLQITSGTAMFLQSASNSTETNNIVLSGIVLTTVSEDQIYPADLSMIANPYATDLDLNDVSFDWSYASAHSLSRFADKLYVWNEGSGGYDSYFFNASSNWVALIAADTNAVIPVGVGAFYDAQGSFTNSIHKTF